jgi:hypothetical protein
VEAKPDWRNGDVKTPAWRFERIQTLADVMTSGLTGRALEVQLHTFGASMPRDEVFAAISIAMTLFEADIVIAQLEAKLANSERG